MLKTLQPLAKLDQLVSSKDEKTIKDAKIVSKKTSKKTSHKTLTTKSSSKKQKKLMRSMQDIPEQLDALNRDFFLKSPSAQRPVNKNKISIQRLESMSNISPESLLLLAGAYYDKGDYQNQIRILKKLVVKYKKNGVYWLELVRAFRQLYFKTADPTYHEQTVETIHHTLKLAKKYHEPAQQEMLKLLKFSKDEEKNYYAILNLMQDMVNKFGYKKLYIKELCKYLYLNKFYDRSRTVCKKAIKKNPKSASNYVYYALSMKDNMQIEKHLKLAAKKFPRSIFAQVQAGDIFLEQKTYPLARGYYQKALRLDSKSAAAQAGLAQSLFGMGQFRQAYPHFIKACLLNKSEYLWIFKQAKSILNQKNHFSLAESFQKGINRCFHQAASI